MKKVICAVLCIAVCLCLCSCGVYSVDTNELLSTPRLTGKMYDIEKALKKSISGGYTLEYPKLGKKRSAVILEDVDGDKTKEAFVFYSVSDPENKYMHLNIVEEENEKYKSKYDFKIVASSVEQIEFCDFNADGKKEIVVGFDVFGNNDKTLVAFRYENGKLYELMTNEYTGFLCCDLIGNGKNQLLIQKITAKDNTNTATLFGFNNKGFSKVSSCNLDGNVSAISNTVLSNLSTGEPAVYIDEIKGVGAITEVLFVSKGMLVNPLLNMDDKGGTMKMLRLAGIPIADINNDKIPEIPVAMTLPNADKNSSETLDYIKWCSFNGEMLTVKRIDLVNVIDGYSLIVPARWVGNIAAVKDIDKRTRTVTAYDPALKTVGKPIITVKVTDKDDSSEDYDKIFAAKNGEKFIMKSGDYEGKLKLTEKETESIFVFNNF